MQEPTTFCKLPNTGLGNQLFPLMKAMVYSKLMGQKVRVCNYNQFKIGPYLRGEKSKRKYENYFTFQKGFSDDMVTRISIRFLLQRNEIISNPTISSNNEKSVVFDAIPHWDNFFEGLNEYRELVIKCLFDILNPTILETYHNLPPPEIGLHVRLGDFRKLKSGEDFKKVGAVRTPEYYFIDTVKKLRALHGSELPVTIFTDGYKKDMPDLFSLSNLIIPKPNTDIGDLLHLSKSKIIVTSAGSTFSYWAGFLSDSPIILHPDHIHQPIRLEQGLFEGSIDSYLNKTNP